jgi:hypothetical protein
MIPETYNIFHLLAPAADAAGRTSAQYASLKNAKRAWIYCSITQGNAATILLTPLQATSVAGTGSKVLTKACPIYVNLDTAASGTWVRATDAVNYTTDAGVKLKTIVFLVDPATLDLANSFDCLGVSTGASNAANITSVHVIVENRYAQAVPPSLVAD